MYRSVVVEDEQLASQYLCELIRSHSDISIIGSADVGHKAITLINKERPDLVFLDIQLPDMTGFEVLEQLDYQPMVIFTTAYEKYAIQAFESFCVDYLVKPITPDRFHQSLDKLSRIQQPQSLDFNKLTIALQALKDEKKISAIPITIGDKIILVECESITHISGEDKYVRLHTTSGKSHLSNKTLNQMASNLPMNFIRAHRSHIINKDHITEIRKYFKGNLMLHMADTDGSIITTSSQYKDSVKEVLGIK